MIVEYVAADLLGRIRITAAPVTSARTVVSLGLEEHASHSTQAAWACHDLLDLAARPAGLRAGRRGPRAAPRPRPGRGLPRASSSTRVDAALPDVRPDHVLGPELQAAAELLRSGF